MEPYELPRSTPVLYVTPCNDFAIPHVTSASVRNNQAMSSEWPNMDCYKILKIVFEQDLSFYSLNFVDVSLQLNRCF